MSLPPSANNLALPLFAKHQSIWTTSYQEEYDGLQAHGTFDLITQTEYTTLSQKHGKALPSMCILVVKKDKEGSPTHAKSHIIVLGNHEKMYWTKRDCFALIASHTNVHSLISLTIKHGCMAKQGDCKNEFCHPHLPYDEVILV